MSEKTTTSQPEASTTQLITISKDRKAVTSSLTVAEFFGKRHDHVLRDIEELAKKGLPNFGCSSYSNDASGRSYKMYEMDRTGFTLLAMGFTGEKALDFKIRYILAFDAMEAELMSKKEPKRLAVSSIDELPDEAMMGNPKTWAVWSWFLSRAGSAPCRKLCGGVPVDLAAGELLFTETILASDLNLNRRVVRRCIDFLVKYGKVSRRSTNKFSIITILDWAERKGGTLMRPEPLPEPAPKTAPTPRRLPAPLPNPAHVQTQNIGLSENVSFLIEHYKSMIAEYRIEIAGYRNELSFYRGLYKGIERTDYARITNKARKCLSTLAPSYVGLNEETIVELALCMAAGGGRGGNRMDS